ncbi:MAG: hypothetical protein NZ580_05255 [Bacteroidia bacterium]|nr:hypothetical protein [Bacteroidia bacterium]MDW8236286.1 hypothetical protein [Bacteroidia bacterium]
MIVLSPAKEVIGFALLGGWLGYVGYKLEWHRKPTWLYLALIAKVLSAWAFGWLYQAYYCHGDTLKVYLTAERLAHYLWNAPDIAVALLLRELSSQWEAIGWKVFWQDAQLFGYDYEWSEPSNYIFYRLSLPLYIAAGGGYYGMQGLAGIIGGLLSYAAYRRWEHTLGLHPVTAWIWFFLPSTLLWTSGLLRDTFAFPLTLYAAGWIASARSVKEIQGILAILILALLRIEGLALAATAGIAFRTARFKVTFIAAIIGFVLALGKVLGPWSYLYRSEALSPQLHPEVPEASVFYLSFEPTFGGSCVGWAKALFPALIGPLPWEIRKPFVLLYAIESWGIAVLIGFAIRKLWQRKAFSARNLILIGIGLAVLGVVAMAMPYWGTLARQRLYGLYWLLLGLQPAFYPPAQQRQDTPS